MKKLTLGVTLLVLMVGTSWRAFYPWGLSDADQRLFEYATASDDRAKMMNTTEPLGLHRGLPVVAAHPCADLCPDYTTRIIGYELQPDQTCASAGGVEKTFLVPEGVSANNRGFCVPRVIADYWWVYRK